MSGLGAWAADAVVMTALAIMTVAVIGAIRLPDVYMKLHASAKAASLAILLLALATVAGGEPEVFLRALLAATFLIITAPVSAQVITRAAADSDEPMRAPDTVDESGWISGRRGCTVSSSTEEESDGTGSDHSHS